MSETPREILIFSQAGEFTFEPPDWAKRMRIYVKGGSEGAHNDWADIPTDLPEGSYKGTVGGTVGYVIVELYE